VAPFFLDHPVVLATLSHHYRDCARPTLYHVFHTAAGPTIVDVYGRNYTIMKFCCMLVRLRLSPACMSRSIRFCNPLRTVFCCAFGHWS